nr:hypothetical protein [Candidatus Sigynarchaeum springense]
MKNDLTPEIKEISFLPLSKALLESVLKRTIEYDCTDHVLAMEAWQVLSGPTLDYRKSMQDIAVLLLGDTWNMISKEPSDNGVPVLVFQKDRVNMLFAGARSGDLGMVVVMITAASKSDLALAAKTMEKITGKHRAQK